VTKRNPSIDVLRGAANVLMIPNHVGAASHVNTAFNLAGWFDPAGAFVLLAGVVLGLGVRGDKPVWNLYGRVSKMWRTHVLLTAAVIALHELTGRLDSPSVAALGGPFAALWKLLALRAQPRDYMNILPMFIVCFLGAPWVVLALRRGLTALVLAGSLALYGFAQVDPAALRFTDLACGPEAFVMAAWQFTFVVGLLAGFHATRLGELYRAAPRAVWISLFVIVAALCLGAFVQRPSFRGLGLALPPHLTWATRKEAWGPLRALYTCALLALSYLAVDRLYALGRGRGLDWLSMLGRKSMYCFLVHLPFALLASGLLLPAQPLWFQDLAALLTIAIVYGLAKHDVLARYLPV
jgi:hypothetical protein